MITPSMNYAGTLVDEVEGNCSLLQNPNFVECYPHIREVSAYMHGVKRTFDTFGIDYEYFSKLNVDSIDGFLELLLLGNEDAYRIYEDHLRDTIFSMSA